METHVVKPSDRKRIRCGDWSCPYRSARAMICEHSHWNTGNAAGVSFYYLCRACARRRGLLAKGKSCAPTE